MIKLPTQVRSLIVFLPPRGALLRGFLMYRHGWTLIDR